MKQGFVKALRNVKRKLFFCHFSVAPGPNARIQGRKSVFNKLVGLVVHCNASVIDKSDRIAFTYIAQRRVPCKDTCVKHVFKIFSFKVSKSANMT